jgi:SAM-dependent methyltransferase
VKHWQASRALKADGRALNAKPYFYTQAGKLSRANNYLWRDAEAQFWISQGTAHIKPEIGRDFPEGFDVGQALRVATAKRFPVLEVGCGTGRIASLFEPGEYLGVDVSPTAVIQARASLPDHRFGLTDQGIEFPSAPTVLFYTVLLHIAERALAEILHEASKGRSRVVIAEIMDSRWRRAGDPPVFNRNPEDYVLAMVREGFHLAFYAKHPYQRYQNLGLEQDVRITFLTFDRSLVQVPLGADDETAGIRDIAREEQATGSG